MTDLALRNSASAVGKRFGRLKRLVLQDGDSRSKCFHSIRKFVVTTLEQAGISEGIAADLVGQEKPNITYNVYSNGSSVAGLRQAIQSLWWRVWELQVVTQAVGVNNHCLPTPR